MSCAETQKHFSPYLDGRLPQALRATVGTHLKQCPVCRFELAELRGVVRGLAQLERPAPPVGLTAAISDALLIERAARRSQPQRPLQLRCLLWLRPRMMPYAVGALASCLLFVGVTSALRPHVGLLRELARAAQEDSEETQRVMFVGPTDFATASGMPSLNPNGELARLVRSPAEGGADDDDMAIVADVFSNGSASLAEVVQTPRNRHMLDEVEAALRKAPAFVPAALDQRPQTMRVVLSLSKVNVREHRY